MLLLKFRCIFMQICLVLCQPHKTILLFTSYSSVGTFSSHNNGWRVRLSSKPNEHVCNLPLKKIIKKTPIWTTNGSLQYWISQFTLLVCPKFLDIGFYHPWWLLVVKNWNMLHSWSFWSTFEPQVMTPTYSPSTTCQI